MPKNLDHIVIVDDNPILLSVLREIFADYSCSVRTASDGLEALAEHITPRTAWFIAHHMEAQELLDGTLGARARRRLEASEDFDELKLLARCDRQGRQRGLEDVEAEDQVVTETALGHAARQVLVRGRQNADVQRLRLGGAEDVSMPERQ